MFLLSNFLSFCPNILVHSLFVVVLFRSAYSNQVKLPFASNLWLMSAFGFTSPCKPWQGVKGGESENRGGRDAVRERGRGSDQT